MSGPTTRTIMKETKKISVVLITYNHAKFISEAIDSILRQTHDNLELIIIDDGSTDNTMQKISEFRDPRLTVTTQKNAGPSVALNVGIDVCQGDFIALMSGDDVSDSNRLHTQLNQLEMHAADIVFSRPEIIDANSQVLGWEAYPTFFGKTFSSTPSLFNLLFYGGNFLCASTTFARSSALKTVGEFKRSLLQLQDFDFWLRACKSGLDIKLFDNPLIQYRYFHGSNLSDVSNYSRIKLERKRIYTELLDGASPNLLREAFGQKISIDSDEPLDIEIDKSLLLIEHPDPEIRQIGVNRLAELYENDKAFAKLSASRSLPLSKFFELERLVENEATPPSPLEKIGHFLRALAVYFVKLPLDASRLVVSDKHIQSQLNHGNYSHAISLARSRGRARVKHWNAIRSLLQRVSRRLRSKLLSGQEIRILSIVRKRWRSTDIYDLREMSGYCKNANIIIHQENPERVFISRPTVKGLPKNVSLQEGYATCPPPYIATLSDALVVGGSAFVVTPGKMILSDELAQFTGSEFGVKSHQVLFRDDKKLIVDFSCTLNCQIQEGILLSCDHDENYFHWLLECLPKLTFLNSLDVYKHAPILISRNLHANLHAALRKINFPEREVIQLDKGFGYQVKKLIYPSPLSRIIDRYEGPPSFDRDIVFSKKWISKTVNLLKDSLEQNLSPQRKLFLTRSSGLRSLGNKELLETTLIRNGFEIVDVGRLNFEAQIALFSQASIVVAPTGAALTNIIFCQPGTKIIAFMSNHDTTNYYIWSQLGEITGLQVKIIAGQRLYNLTNYYSVHDDYTLDPDLVLKEILNDA